MMHLTYGKLQSSAVKERKNQQCISHTSGYANRSNILMEAIKRKIIISETLK